MSQIPATTGELSRSPWIASASSTWWCPTQLHDQDVALTDLTTDRLDRAYEEVFAVNVKGALLMVHAALDELIRNRGSTVSTGLISSLRRGSAASSTCRPSTPYRVLPVNPPSGSPSIPSRWAMCTPTWPSPRPWRAGLRLREPDQAARRLPTGVAREPADVCGRTRCWPRTATARRSPARCSWRTQADCCGAGPAPLDRPWGFPGRDVADTRRAAQDPQGGDDGITAAACAS
jgi:hypothetical protein